MNYQKIYDDICKRGQERILPKEVYTEKHHIIPKCLGGNNEKSNLTVLTAREHFLVHYILAEKLYPTHYGLYHALYLMCHTESIYQIRHKPSAKTYEKIRHNAMSLMSEHKRMNPSRGEKNGMFGKKHSEEAKKKMSESSKGRPGKRDLKHTDESKKKMSETRKERSAEGKYRDSGIGKHKRTPENKKKLSESIKKGYENGRVPSFLNKKHSEETKKKFKEQRFETQTGDNNHNARKILHIETGQVFGSRKSAREFFGLSSYKFMKLFNLGEFKDLNGSIFEYKCISSKQ